MIINNEQCVLSVFINLKWHRLLRREPTRIEKSVKCFVIEVDQLVEQL